MMRSILVLEAIDVSLALPDRRRRPVFGRPPAIEILKNINLSVGPGELIGLVGESGSGKSTLGRTLLRLHAPQAGHIMFQGVDLGSLSKAELRHVRLQIQMVFQNSLSSLNPRKRILDTVAAPFVAHRIATTRQAGERAMRLLKQVGLTDIHADRYPHQLSGGQRQRVGIARALTLNPTFIIADEILSGLDVSVQAQMITLLRTLRTNSGVGMVFISHDLSVVRTLCDRVAVMQRGQIVECGDCAAIFERPQHAYTKSLLQSIPLPIVDKTWLLRTTASGGEQTEPAAP